MTDLPFAIKGRETEIKFGAGQPLGARSSWAIFTLCHHLVVHIAAARSNSPAQYVILGDDIVLKGHALATEYRKIMQDLGVSISETKSHVSRDTFEFAKIWIRRGINVSGFPIVGLIETMDKPVELASLIHFEVPTKGYHLDYDPRSLSSCMEPLIKLYTSQPRKAM